MEKEKELPSVILTERAAQVFKDSCEAEGLTLQGYIFTNWCPTRRMFRMEI
ncbi:MAG: hypothetical protein CM1200mP28_10920 [Deltaproteobacteria bacterium]|nr:MAG: hypothetical protein CM1200mP28_10920 [Deltaproteobacteria bacterium]